MDLVMYYPDGATTTVASNLTYDNAAHTLGQARKAYFGRKGRISYTNLEATHDGYKLKIIGSA